MENKQTQESDIYIKMVTYSCLVIIGILYAMSLVYVAVGAIFSFSLKTILEAAFIVIAQPVLMGVSAYFTLKKQSIFYILIPFFVFVCIYAYIYFLS